MTQKQAKGLNKVSYDYNLSNTALLLVKLI